MAVTEGMYQRFGPRVKEQRQTWFVAFSLLLFPCIPLVPGSTFYRCNKMSYILHYILDGKVHLSIRDQLDIEGWTELSLTLPMAVRIVPSLSPLHSLVP
jgi:hypothetical protein